MKFHLRCFRSLVLGLMWLLPAVGAGAEPAVIAALKADQARLAAMAAGDGVALGKLMSDQLNFVHSDGRVESKKDYVQNVLAGDVAYADVKTLDVETTQISADVVVVFGVQQMRKRLGAEWSNITLRYLGVWRNEAGHWRLVAWQSARPSGNSVVPGKK